MFTPGHVSFIICVNKHLNLSAIVFIAAQVRCSTEHQAPGAVFILTIEKDGRETADLSLRVTNEGFLSAFFS